MAVIYTHVTYEEFKAVEKAMKEFKETTHQTTPGFYHKSIRMPISKDLILEIHAPLVGGYGHQQGGSNGP